MPDTYALALRTGTPPPLEALTHAVVSPENIALEQRQRHAETLSLKQKWETQKALKGIRRELKGLGYADFRTRYHLLKPDMDAFRERYLALKEAEDQEGLSALQVEMEAMLYQWQQLGAQWRELEPLVSQKRALAQRLEDHELAKSHERAVRRLQRDLQAEAGIYARLIINKWTRLGYCHRFTQGNQTITRKVKFDSYDITPDAIYYKISTSFKTAMGGWDEQMPEGIHIAKDLLNPDTLTELSITCQRQVTGEYNTNGAWVIVHRLDSYDGLMNYVRFEDVLDYYPAQHHDRLPICVGVGYNRTVKWINLGDYPHWLIAGYTGSGKSNLVNVAICTLISKHSPEELRLVLIDLKAGAEFGYYEHVPHVYGGIVDKVSEISDRLGEMEALMMERLAFLRHRQCRNIVEFKAKFPDATMPRVVIVFDEVASIMAHGDTTTQIMHLLRQLTRLGRAAGIHVILCTQRPDVKAIDGSVKANLAVRISGRLPSGADSQTILGTTAAKDLPSILGRMILQLGPDPEMIQVPHISDTGVSESIGRAQQYKPPEPLPIPQTVTVTSEWTPARVAELSITHLNGNISWKAVYDAISDDVSRQGARKLVEALWKMGQIEYQGTLYEIRPGKGKEKYLVKAA